MSTQKVIFTAAEPAVYEVSNISVVQMSVDSWIDVADHPYQRNTEARLERALRTHLGKPSSEHVQVKMVELPDGTQWKLDGHTRSLGWKLNKMPRPDKVIVAVTKVHSKQEAYDLYKQVDSLLAVEKFTEKAFGAGRANKIENLSDTWFGRQGRFGGPARFASAFRRGQANPGRTIEVEAAVGEHRDAIVALLALKPQSQYFVVGVAAAFILTYERFGEAALPFWQAYARKGGSMLDGESDGIQALHQYVGSNRKGGGRISAEKTEKTCGVALACFEAYNEGRCYKSTPRAKNALVYFPAGKSMKSI
jgi:hypothetical protein